MSEVKKDSGFIFKLFVRLSAIGVGATAYLPFYQNRRLMELGPQVWEQFQTEGISALNMLFFEGAAESIAGKMMTWFLIMIPVIAALMAVYMLLTGKYAGWPFTFSLIVFVIGWVGFVFLGSNFDAGTSFFGFVNTGFWACLGGLSLPFLAMFFLDKSI